MQDMEIICVSSKDDRTALAVCEAQGARKLAISLHHQDLSSEIGALLCRSFAFERHVVRPSSSVADQLSTAVAELPLRWRTLLGALESDDIMLDTKSEGPDKALIDIFEQMVQGRPKDIVRPTLEAVAGVVGWVDQRITPQLGRAALHRELVSRIDMHDGPVVCCNVNDESSLDQYRSLAERSGADLRVINVATTA